MFSSKLISRSSLHKVICFFIAFQSLECHPQALIDSVIKYYQSPTLSYSFTETHYSTENVKTTGTGTLYAIKKDQSALYTIIHEQHKARNQIIKNENHYGSNNYTKNYYDNFLTDSSDLKTFSLMKGHHIFIQDSTLLFSQLKNKRFTSKVESLPGQFLLTLENNAEEKIKSNLGEVTRKKELLKYHISKKDYSIIRSFSYLHLDFFGLDFKDSTVFTYQNLNIPEKTVIRKIKDFKPLRNARPVQKAPAEISEFTGKIFPSFNLPDTGKRLLNQAEIKSKYVMVELWYKGCGPCLMNMDNVESLRKQFRSDDLAIIAINAYDPINDEVKSLIKKLNKSFLFLFNGKGLSEAFKINSYPTTFIYDNSTRQIIFHHTGGGPGYTQLVSDFLNKHLSSDKKD